MNSLVFVENNRVVTDSLTVAEVFGKDHDKVMRDINNQIEKLNEAGEQEFIIANFGDVEYKDSRNRTQNKYLLTQEAFAIVTMAYTTVEAMKFKVNFIHQFNTMRQQLSMLKMDSYMIDNPIQRAQRWIQEQQEKIQLEQQLQIVAPKASKYDQFLDSDGYMSMSDLAKLINIKGFGRNKLMEFLRDAKVLMSNNTPYQRFMNQEYFKVVQKVTRNGRTNSVTLVTPKGADWIIDLVKEKKESWDMWKVSQVK